MNENQKGIKWILYKDDLEVAGQARERVLRAAHQAIRQRGVFHIVLPGGRTPVLVFQQLVDADTEWSRWHIYYGDERCVPPDDPRRNSLAADAAWFSGLGGARPHVFPIPAEEGPERGARRYQALIRPHLPFDMVILGMGEDGHTASLFPGFEESAGDLVLPVYDAPKAPAERVSLSSLALSNARSVLILVTGESKRKAVARWRQGEDLPIGRIYGRHTTEVLLDPAAMPEKIIN